MNARSAAEFSISSLRYTIKSKVTESVDKEVPSRVARHSICGRKKKPWEIARIEFGKIYLKVYTAIELILKQMSM